MVKPSKKTIYNLGSKFPYKTSSSSVAYYSLNPVTFTPLHPTLFFSNPFSNLFFTFLMPLAFWLCLLCFSYDLARCTAANSHANAQAFPRNASSFYLRSHYTCKCNHGMLLLSPCSSNLISSYPYPMCPYVHWSAFIFRKKRLCNASLIWAPSAKLWNKKKPEPTSPQTFRCAAYSCFFFFS